MNAANRSRSSLQIRDAVDFDTCPSPASSHNDSASRIDSPRTNAPITIAFNGSVRRNRFPRGNSLDTNGSAASRTCGISTSTGPSAACTLRGRNPLRFPGAASGLRSYRARPSQLSNSSSTARWMISFAPSDASSDNAPCGSSAASPPASSPSILCSISADDSTLRLTAYASFNRLAGLEGTYAVALTATDLQQLRDATYVGHSPGTRALRCHNTLSCGLTPA